MTKAQWSAVYHYCTEYGYDSPKELLEELKANGKWSAAQSFPNLMNMSVAQPMMTCIGSWGITYEQIY